MKKDCFGILPRFFRACLLSLLVVVVVCPVQAGAQGLEGISYTLTPSIDLIRWEENLGMEDTELYGGRLSLNFGKYISLQGYYLLRANAETRLASLDLRDAGDQPLVDQDVDLRNYGTDIVMNLGRGPVIPFIKAGAGVMQFETDDGDEMSQIMVKLGGGFRFGIDRLRASVWVEDAAIRLNRYDLASNAPSDPAFLEDEDAEDIRHNLSFGFGMDVPLGGYSGSQPTETDRAVAERYRAGLKGISIPIEPYIGKIDYDEDLRLSDQEFLGIRSGLDFGPYFGLRGYYWRGFEKDFGDTDPVQSYGGEARFNLNAGQGGIPYLLVGVGQLDYMSDFKDDDGLPRMDKTMLTLGGGVGLSIGDRFMLDLSVRDYVFSDRNLEDVSNTDELVHNLVLAAGLRFSFGGGYGSGRVPQPKPPVITPVSETIPTYVDVPVQSESPAVEEVQVAAEEPASTVAAPVEQVVPAEQAVITEPAEPTEPATYHGERRVTIPVPTQGEIYVRYGHPGGVQVESRFEGREAPLAQGAPAKEELIPASQDLQPAPLPASADTIDTDALREMIRSEFAAMERRVTEREAPAVVRALPTDTIVRTVKPAESYSGLTSEQQLELLERRLAERIDERIDSRVKEMEERQPGVTPTTVVLPEDRPAVAVVSTDAVDATAFEWKPKVVTGYIGANVDDPEQFILGGRLDLGPLSRRSSLNFVPELALGFGSSTTSFMFAVNLRYDFRPTVNKGTWSPYLSAGAGITHFSEDVSGYSGQEGVLNLGYGITANFGRISGFMEHQGIDLFDLNRILLGLKWRL